ncbi:hypothetical protein WN51_08481 [Melipona quadrifasciata]|uniref:Uncharacterized protein n=1 Tax=Melipona quadrifasciata TaxID=166423 RepID=A0A0N0BKA1_9HYME|nr:hypothetical protein WN51_08481 [Melipona quadrifasciata]
MFVDSSWKRRTERAHGRQEVSGATNVAGNPRQPCNYSTATTTSQTDPAKPFIATICVPGRAIDQAWLGGSRPRDHRDFHRRAEINDTFSFAARGELITGSADTSELLATIRLCLPLPSSKSLNGGETVLEQSSREFSLNLRKVPKASPTRQLPGFVPSRTAGMGEASSLYPVKATNTGRVSQGPPREKEKVNEWQVRKPRKCVNGVDFWALSNVNGVNLDAGHYEQCEFER